MPESNNVRKWTVVVCLAGDNNLSTEMVYAIKEMKRVEKISPDGPVTVIALLDPTKGLPTQAYVIDPGDVDNRLITEAKLVGSVKKNGRTVSRADIIEPLEVNTSDIEVARINTGDPKTLSALLSKFLDKYRAEHYMIVLSGHGSGAENDFLLKDEGAADALTIKEMTEVIIDLKRDLQKKQPGRKIDILGLDSCLMSMAEVFYELSNIEQGKNNAEKNNKDEAKPGNLVDFLVGAEGFAPNTGWPYQRVLETLAGNPDMDPETYAKKIVEDYILYYADYALAGLSVDLAACDLREDNCLNLKRKVKLLVQKLKSNLKIASVRDAIILAHWEAQSYKIDQYTDLLDFCELLAGRSKRNQEIKQACEGVVGAVKQIVKKSCYSGPAVQYSFGLSVYFPWDRVSPPYQNLQYAQDTDWHEFLRMYVDKTRRPQRKECVTPRNMNHSIQRNLFNPTSEEVAAASISVNSANVKFVLPENEGIVGQAMSMKNPPIQWCPCDCTDEADGGVRSQKVRKARPTKKAKARVKK